MGVLTTWAICFYLYFKLSLCVCILDCSLMALGYICTSRFVGKGKSLSNVYRHEGRYW